MEKTLKLSLSWKLPLLLAVLVFLVPTQCFAYSVTLQWDANTEPDLTGYYLYYRTDPYDQYWTGVGADQGPSPIEIPLYDLVDEDYPEYTLTGLDDNETYYFVVTAYNTEYEESGYSNQASTDQSIPSNNSGGQGVTGYASSNTSGGGGCFIATAAVGTEAN